MGVSPLLFNGSFLEYVNIRKGHFLCIQQENVKRKSNIKEKTSPCGQVLGNTTNTIKMREDS